MFYDRYVLLCKDVGLSTSAAATQAGINKGTVSVWKKKWEQGIDVDPDKATIEKLCALFKKSEAELRGVSIPDEKIPSAVSGEGMSELDRELYSIWETASGDERRVLLEMARMLKNRRA